MLPMAIKVTKRETNDRYTQKFGRETPPARVNIKDSSWAINIAKKMIRALQKSGRNVCSAASASLVFD